MTTAVLPQQAAMDSAVRHLIGKYSPKGNKVGWLMMASILVEAWDLYCIAFVLIFIRDQYHPDPSLLGLAAAGTQGGAVIGALFGGWLVRQDRPPRHVSRDDGAVHRAGARAGVRDERRLAHRDPLLPRRTARKRYLDRLHLHHGIDGQGRARGDGQPLAIHVRDRRGHDAGGDRDLPHSRSQPRDSSGA